MVTQVRNLPWTPDTGLPVVGGRNESRNSRSTVDGSAKLLATPSIWAKEKQVQSNGLLVPPLDSRKRQKLAKNVKETAGAKWFDMPSATVTPEMKRELQLLSLRGVLDPKRHYKANDSKAVPKFFQVGTVVEGPAEFYSGRLTNKQRKLTFADELLTDTSLKSYSKRKYLAIQEEKESGGKKFWKKKKNRQKPSWART